ncbi:MAG TPA: hypothetical protein VJJ82_04665 [Candidatus Nanoarchaeia archaeon]|nr:hypothetical protein [Candidatus Nanoarchaeia archaeon]
MHREYSSEQAWTRKLSLITTQAFAKLQHRARSQALGFTLLVARGEIKRGKEVVLALDPNNFCALGE